MRDLIEFVLETPGPYVMIGFGILMVPALVFRKYLGLEPLKAYAL